MHKKFYLSLLLAVSVLLSSCQKYDEIPQTDYSIESSSYFEVISQHQNGWIKQGQQNFVYPESQVSKEVEPELNDESSH